MEAEQKKGKKCIVEEDWQAGSQLHRHAGTHNLWLVEDHATGDKVRQARLKTGVSYPDPSREDLDSKRHANQELTALRIQILAKRHSDSARAHSDPEAARRLLERDEKELRDRDFSFGTFRIHPKRCKTSSVGQSTGLLILRSSVRFRQKLKKLRTQIYMDLRYIDPQARVLNYFYK